MQTGWFCNIRNFVSILPSKALSTSSPGCTKYGQAKSIRLASTLVWLRRKSVVGWAVVGFFVVGASVGGSVVVGFEVGGLVGGFAIVGFAVGLLVVGFAVVGFAVGGLASACGRKRRVK